MPNSFANIRKLMDEEMLRDAVLIKTISPYFKDKAELEKFIRKCLKKNQTRWMLNRTRSLSELADYQKYDSVKLFFLIALMEVIVKLSEGRFKDHSSESADVEKFFNSFPDEDKKIMRKCFFRSGRFLETHNLRFPTIINVLLNVRHRLVHGKSHYDFVFHSGQENLYNPIWGEIGPRGRKKIIRYELTLTYIEFRSMVIKNAISYIKKCF